MAELDVQPKKKTSWWPWLLLAIILLALILFLSRSCNKTKTVAATTPDSTVNNGTTVPEGTTSSGWDNIDFNAPIASYDEITNKDINVRGNDKYAIYSLGENVLFDEGKSTIRPDAEQNLKQLSASIQKRFNEGDVRIYGHTDSIGGSDANKQLAEQRADAVRSWLIANGNIDENRISVHPVGESQPVASNGTESGRQQNRRVEIVVKK